MVKPPQLIRRASVPKIVEWSVYTNIIGWLILATGPPLFSLHSKGTHVVLQFDEDLFCFLQSKKIL